MAAADPPYVVILGAGAIGVSFAACFLDAGARVTLVEPDKTRHGGLGTALKTQQDAIKTAGLAASLAGDLAIASAPPGDLAQSTIVLECGPERLEVKQATFAEMLAKTGDGTVLATASSAIPMSRILPAPADQARCLVTHPVNPPAALRLVELAPAPATSPAVVAKAAGIFASLGFTTVTLHHEVEGFILNRLQGAVLREAYRLVDDGVAGPDDIDTVMRLGLGPRWALSGPFETADVNTPGGITAHAARMGPAYKRMGEARGETVDWHADLVAKVTAARRAKLPERDVPARAAWRANAVARLVAARDRIARGDDD